MLAVKERASVAAVTEDVGQRIKARRTHLGESVKALAERAGVDRGRLAAIEAGRVKNVRPATIGAIERALDELEEQRAKLPPGVMPVGDPADDLFAVEVYTDAGILRAVVKGLPKDADVIRETAQRLMAGINVTPSKVDNGG